MLLAGQLLQLPQGFMTIPGSSIGLLTVLDRDANGDPGLVLTGLTAPDQGPQSRVVFLDRLRLGSSSDPQRTGGYAITWRSSAAFTGMVVKKDPGQGLIWVAYLSLISGLMLTFYFPRRRVWARLADGGLQLAFVADRYVDARREFDQLLADIAARTGQRPTRTVAVPAPLAR